jgi:hypothetical protein
MKCDGIVFWLEGSNSLEREGNQVGQRRRTYDFVVRT